MQVNRKDLNKCGIYCIRNIVNNKVYIGKSKNIYPRIAGHINCLNNRSKDENRHLINAWHKYKKENFEYIILEYFDVFNDIVLSERELFWMDNYKSCERDFGYNLRRDSSSNMIVHEETKQLQSENSKGCKNGNYANYWTDEQKENLSNKIKEQFKNGRTVDPEQCKKGNIVKQENWKKNPELKIATGRKISDIVTKYKIYQYTKQDVLVRIWDKVMDILIANPSYKKHNIYAVCSGEKPSMYSFKWVKVLIDDIVRT